MDARLLSGVTVLATVVERGSFTRAAEVLGLSPENSWLYSHCLTAATASGHPLFRARDFLDVAHVQIAKSAGYSMDDNRGAVKQKGCSTL